MKKMYILSGVPASGKTSFLVQHGLEDYAISLDSLRSLLSSPIDTYNDGDLTIGGRNQSTTGYAAKLQSEIIERRMEYGQTVIIDGTNVSVKNVNRLRRQASGYGYRVYLVKFGRDISLEELLDRDQNRRYPVGKQVIERYLDKQKTFDENHANSYTVLTPEEMLESLEWKLTDLSTKEKVRVIGDVHSSASALKKAVVDLDNENVQYVLLGDYFDRGVEPVQTYELLLELIEKNNITFLKGNHEEPIEEYAYKGTVSRQGFKKETLEPLLKVYSEQEIRSGFRKILKKVQPVYLFRFYNKFFYVSHAGFLPEQIKDTSYQNALVLKDDRIFTRGVGGYDINVSDLFDREFANTNKYQIHGHRNNQLRPVILEDCEKQRSFNLEQKVEYGNQLGILDITLEDGEEKFTDASIQNKVYDSDKYTPYDEYSESFNFKSLSNHPYIKTKSVGGGINVYNFTREAFRKWKWDGMTVKARGLYVDQSNHVVMRGYDKFFNLNEREETSIESLYKRFSESSPVSVVNKANGFLGLVSYIPQLGGLTVFSKGAGEYHSKLAKEVLEDTLSFNGYSLGDLESYLFNLYRYGHRVTLVFEVIDIVSDPHIVYPPRRETVLLDVISNTLEGTTNFDIKQYVLNKFKFNEAETVQTWDISQITLEKFEENINSLKSEKGTEGFVLSDNQDKFRVKIKTTWYSSLKSFRGVIEKALKITNQKGQLEYIKKSIDNLKEDNPDHYNPDVVIEALELVLNEWTGDTPLNRFNKFIFTNESFNIPLTIKGWPELEDIFN